MKLLERLWSLLPDKCDMRGEGCCRTGVRGNENRVLVPGTRDVWLILCDYCTSRFTRPTQAPAEEGK